MLLHINNIVAKALDPIDTTMDINCVSETSPIHNIKILKSAPLQAREHPLTFRGLDTIRAHELKNILESFHTVKNVIQGHKP